MIGLGIDTGGTYTDGVLYDWDQKQVLYRGKSLTTRADLSQGIGRVLGEFPPEQLRRVRMVSLSTTLATNACVEGRGSRCALFLLGYDEGLVGRLGEEYGLHLIEHICVLPGSHGQRGQVLEEPDWAALQARAQALRDRVDAVGVCEYWGIRNPEYEQRAKEVLREATGLPVVVAHELSHEINSLRRAATTALNARLIPLIGELIAAVKRSLTAAGIDAPLMIVRGDGSLMTEQFAGERPVETLLSGPAASVVGAMGLGGLSDCVMLDVGGTTTDMAVARGGLLAQEEDGVDVGGWRTGTRAIGIQTMGLGGDSRIAFDKKGYLTLGPERVIPLSCLSADHPGVLDTLRAIRKANRWTTVPMAEFYCRLRDPGNIELTAHEQRIMDALAQGPLSVSQLAERVEQPVYFLEVGRLIFLGLIARSALTPTDLMHVRGEYAQWDVQAAQLGLETMANRLELTPDQLLDRVFDLAGDMLYRLVCNFLLARTFPRREEMRVEHNPALALGYRPAGDELDLAVTCKLPIVGIGAPAHIFIPRVAEKLHAPCVIPPDAAVANAVGAITGSVLAEERVVIRPQFEAHGVDGFSCHASAALHQCADYEEAMAWARTEAERAVREMAARMGAEQVEVTVDSNESTGEVGGEGAQPLLLETVVTARGMGKISLDR